MSKNKLVFANWKMNLDINSSNKLIKEILDRNLNYENIETYKSDLKLMFSSYDALISKMNSINYN